MASSTEGLIAQIVNVQSAVRDCSASWKLLAWVDLPSEIVGHSSQAREQTHHDLARFRNRYKEGIREFARFKEGDYLDTHLTLILPLTQS